MPLKLTSSLLILERKYLAMDTASPLYIIVWHGSLTSAAIILKPSLFSLLHLMTMSYLLTAIRILLLNALRIYSTGYKTKGELARSSYLMASVLHGLGREEDAVNTKALAAGI